MPHFSILDPGERPPPGYKFLPHHMIFDVKMDLCRKARLVGNGSRTNPSPSLTYASVVSRESV